MRTLKKTLSLLLAVALVLSLTVVGASAAYTGNKVDTLKDAADVGADYSEAVGVMVGLGIIEGYDDGTLRPETTYTREQAAKIIAYMQLGPKDADSLRCTKAPFTDVAADRWSAGYIAYCVEQGIIDGMGDGTFQPEAQLTGYQWAKMLLCAVGYGRNDEYVGSSWSLNTAKDALDKGIFDGDLEGADHTPLQRQQAILYAFNALTSVGVVVYSPSLGDYILAYGEFADRATIEGTLGAKVYGLASVSGIIVDNEAMGYSKTRISVQNKYDVDKTTTGEKADVEVAANTGLDMMYHAVKVWHTNGTAVYVIDKAAVTTLTCLNATETAMKKLGKVSDTLTIGDKEDAEEDNGGIYEYHYVNNGSAGAVGVVYYYGLGELGVRSESKETTVLYEEGRVANKGTVMENAEIKTDISKIDNRDAVVYINPTSKTDTSKEAWHVSAVAYTTVKIADWSRTAMTITTADGTVYEASTFFTGWPTNMDQGVTAILSLDTHGDVISIDLNNARVVGYYTGTTRPSSAHDAWFADAALVAQFVNIETGEPMEVPVTTAWATAANQNYANIERSIRGYYDITDTVLGSDNYAPVAVDETDNVYNMTNVFEDEWAVFDASSYKFSAFDGSGTANTPNIDVYYDADDVVFHIVDSWGSALEVDSYTGVDALLEAYSARSVTMRNIAATGYFDAQGTFYATTIFAFDGQAAQSQMLFFPASVNVFDTITLPDGTGANQVNRFFGVYQNGEELTSGIRVSTAVRNIDRGFYWYSVLDGVYTLIPAEPIDQFIYDEVTVRVTPNGTVYFEPVDDPAEERRVLPEAKILDMRAVDPDDKIDTVDALSDFYYDNNGDYHEIKLQVAYTWNEDGLVDVIYVVDQAYGRVYVTVDETSEAADEIDESGVDRVFENAANVIVDLEKAGVVGTVVNIKYNLDGVPGTEPVTGEIVPDSDGGLSNRLRIDFTKAVNDGDYYHDIEITDTSVTVTLDTDFLKDANGGDKYNYKYDVNNNNTAQDLPENKKIVVEVGDTIKIWFDAKADIPGDEIVANLVLSNGPVDIVDDNFTLEKGDQWSPSFVPFNTVVVEDLTMDYTITLGSETSDAAKYYNFSDIDGADGDLTAASKDTWTIEGIIPGDAIDLYIQRSGDDLTGQYGNCLNITTGVSGPHDSLNTVTVESDSTMVFHFNYIPGGNNDSVNAVAWADKEPNA